jgi:hypothetical protein
MSGPSFLIKVHRDAMPELEVFVHMLQLAAGVFQQELPVKRVDGREDVQQEHKARAENGGTMLPDN